MLADGGVNVSVGRLTPDLHAPVGWLGGVIDFIHQQLPRWRDDPARPPHRAENRLTAQLSHYLNGATRNSHLDNIVFQGEIPDPTSARRTLDLVPLPRGCTIWIGSQKYTLYDPLIPIECKRLPTPSSRKREKREYLHTQKGRKGGVQRFRAGLHGGASDVGAMIGYVQAGAVAQWFATVNRWVVTLARAGVDNWTCAEELKGFSLDAAARTARSTSIHPRLGLKPIALHHLWVEM